MVSNGIFNWKDLKCDLLSLSAHKFGGPKGIGILLTTKKSRKLVINNDISKSQEYSIRPGTQALPLISGLHKALENIKGRIYHTNQELFFEENKINSLSNYLINKLQINNNLEITGSLINRLPNHISFIALNKNFLPIEAYKIVNFMSDNNIAISSGSACSSSSKEPSIILRNINIPENKLFSNIRVSFGKDNNINQVDKFYDLILKCIDIF